MAAAEKNKGPKIEPSISASGGEGVLEVDAQWQLCFVNQAASALLALSDPAPLSSSFLSFLDPVSAQALEEIPQRSQRGAQVLEIRLGAAGSPAILASVIPFFSPEGAFEGAVFFLSDPNTLAHPIKDLLWSERRFRAILGASREIVVVLDSDFKIRYISPGIELALGYRPDELLGSSPEDLSPPQELEGVEQSRLAWASEPGVAVPVSRQMLHRDGSLRKFEGVVINMLDNPYLKGYVINLTDVTERDQLRSRAQEVQRLEGLGRLAGGVAHDFNNILTVVMGQAELLESRAGGDLRLMRGLSEIRAAADRATGLVSQLLAFARRSVAAPRALHIDQHILSLRGTLVHLLGPKVALTVEPSPDLPAVLADPSQVEQVLLNLAANSRDAMPQGGSLIINCSAVALRSGQYKAHPELKAGPYVCMTISDNGTGMDAMTLEHAFEPFFSTKPSGRGTGMGLATCYGIVQQAEGHIDVHSQVGVGTRFDVYWPVAQASQPLKDRAHLSPGEAVPRGTGELIMVVDDEAQVLTLVTEGLRALGYSIQPFASASAALEWLSGGAKPRLLITDIVMPEIGGEALAGKVQVLVPALPVLYISGYAAGAIARPSWLKVGVNFLPKPFALPDLGLIVRRLLEGEA